MEPSHLSATPIQGMNNEMSANTQVFWGTNINTQDLQNKLRDFLCGFRPKPEDHDLMTEEAKLEYANGEPLYITLLKQIAETEDYTLDVDCNHIHEYDKPLYDQLVTYPTDVIPIFDLVAV